MADINYVCPNCGKPVVGDERLFGLSSKCPHCKIDLFFKNRTTLPPLSPASDAAAKDPGPVHDGAQPSVVTLICPHCKVSLELEADYLAELGGSVECPQCRQSFSADSAGKPLGASSERTNPLRNRCKACGASISYADTYCPACDGRKHARDEHEGK